MLDIDLYISFECSSKLWIYALQAILMGFDENILHFLLLKETTGSANMKNVDSSGTMNILYLFSSWEELLQLIRKLQVFQEQKYWNLCKFFKNIKDFKDRQIFADELRN